MPIKIKKVTSYQLPVTSVLAILVTGCWLLASPVRASELPRYEIVATIDTQKHTIKAKQKVTFTNNTDKEISTVCFHIYPHRKYSLSEKRFILIYSAYFKVNPYPEGFQGGDLKINSLSCQGKNLAYKISGEDETILEVSLGEGLQPGASLELELAFEVTIPHSYGRFGWHKNITSLLRWYPMLSVLDKGGWHNYPFYPYHQPYFSEAALYKLTLRCPKEEIVIPSGILKKETLNPDGSKSLLIESELPLRDFGLVLSPDYKVKSQEINGVKINSYYLAGDEFCAAKAIEFARGLIIYYSKKFTPYPYPEFNLAPAYLAYGGTQSSGLILLDTRLYHLPKFLIRYFDFMVSHETGHQWFYNLVGSDEYKEMFIDEGINSYFVLEYLENKYGPGSGMMVLPKALGWFIPNFSFRRAQLDRYSLMAKCSLDRPVLGELSSFQEPSSIFSITYGKGSKIIGMLKDTIGDESFNKLMQRYFSDFKFKNISVLDFQGLASHEANMDLSWFFQDWLSTTKKCDYALKRVRAQEAVVANRADIPMPVEVKVTLKDKSELNYSFSGFKKEKIIPLEKASGIKSVQIDPDKKILDLDRVNNNWRKRVYPRVVPLYYPIYEIPVFLKDDGYSLILGPQLGVSDLGIRSSLQRPQDNILYLSSVYNFGEERIKNTVGFEQRHLAGKLLRWGLEGFSYKDASGHNDQDGFKLYLRQELWPVSYGLRDENDHLSLYLLRNRDFKSSLAQGGLEDIRNVYYRQQEQTILGVNFKIGRYGPYPDLRQGWKFISTLENAEHFLGGKDYFWRLGPELSRYFEITPSQGLAARFKLGLGWPADKGLFQLGGENGLRGYGYKTINGSQALMFNLEYRRTLIEDLDIRFLGNIISLNRIQGLGFFDLGKSWFRSFGDRSFKKDAGIGLRLHFALASFLENFILRLDCAQAVNQPKAKRHYWFGFGHTF